MRTWHLIARDTYEPYAPSRNLVTKGTISSTNHNVVNKGAFTSHPVSRHYVTQRGHLTPSRDKGVFVVGIGV